jgi:hypothetical protein
MLWAAVAVQRIVIVSRYRCSEYCYFFYRIFEGDDQHHSLEERRHVTGYGSGLAAAQRTPMPTCRRLSSIPSPSLATSISRVER